MPNPYINSNTPTVVCSYNYLDVDITSDHTFTDQPRAIIVNNAGTSLQTLVSRAEGHTADASIVCGPGATVLPISPEIIRANANLTVVALY